MNWYQDKIKQHKQYQSLKVISDIDVLYPPMAFLIIKLFINAYKEGLKVCIFETYRSQERQLDLFNKGTSKIKSNGMHHFGVATDIVFRNEKNYPIWRGSWDVLGKIGKDLGLYWGGDWKGFIDCPHFQLIPATVADQAKIIGYQYPEYDEKIDGQLKELLLFCEKVKSSNYAEESFKELISCYDGLFVPPKKEEVEEPKDIPVVQEEIKTKEKTEDSNASNNFIIFLINLLKSVFVRKNKDDNRDRKKS